MACLATMFSFRRPLDVLRSFPISVFTFYEQDVDSKKTHPFIFSLKKLIQISIDATSKSIWINFYFKFWQVLSVIGLIFFGGKNVRAQIQNFKMEAGNKTFASCIGLGVSEVYKPPGVDCRYGTYGTFFVVAIFQVINIIVKAVGPPKSLRDDEWKWRNLFISWLHALLCVTWIIYR